MTINFTFNIDVEKWWQNMSCQFLPSQQTATAECYKKTASCEDQSLITHISTISAKFKPHLFYDSIAQTVQVKKRVSTVYHGSITHLTR